MEVLRPPKSSGRRTFSKNYARDICCNFANIPLSIFAFDREALGVFQRPLTMILLQHKNRNANGRYILIQIGGVCATSPKESNNFPESLSRGRRSGTPQSWDAVDLGICPKRESLQKWLGEGARGLVDSFEPRDQRSPESLLHHPNPLLHRCNPISHQCKRPLARGVQKTFCTLS